MKKIILVLIFVFLINSSINLSGQAFATSNSQKIKAYIGLADLYVNYNELTKAIDVLDNAILLDPNNLQILTLLADLYYKNSQTIQALQTAKKIIGLNPKNVTAHKILAKIYLEKIENASYKDPLQEALGQEYSLKECFKSLTFASGQNPADPELHTGLANYYLFIDQQSMAFDELFKAIELGINNSQILYEVGEFYFKTSYYEKAISNLKKSISLGLPKSYRAHYLLALTYEKLADFENACKEYEKVLKLKPDHFEAKNNLDELKNISY